MTAPRATVGIYGIHDLAMENYPVYVHDHSMVLFSDGELQKYLHLERLTRVKYDHRLPYKIYDILKSEGLFKKDYDVVFADNTLGKAFISGYGNIRFEADQTAYLSTELEKGKLYWLDKHITGYLLNHELAHLYSIIPFCGSFKENSLLFHFDGGASKGNYSVWLFRDQKLSLIQYGWELKELSASFNANALVFGLVGASQQNQNSVPGKFMGYTAYGKADPQIEKWLIKHDFFADTWKSKKPFFKAAKEELDIELRDLDLHNPFLKDLAATIQNYFNHKLIAFLSEQQQKVQADYLYYSGGSALNIVTNTALLKSGLFKDIFIPPCPNDAGLSIGAATGLELKKGHSIKSISPYCNNWGIAHYQVKYDRATLQQTAKLLMQNKIIGICNGFAEAGPRALGNRSIVALANDKKLAEMVSVTHKKREWYRPVAPIMLLKNLSRFTEDTAYHNLSRFMLLNYLIKPEARKELEGAVHVDESSRIQTLQTRDENPFMYDLLEYLEATYGVKALLNTSFNRKDEPIVHTIEDAQKSAREMKLDALISNGRLGELT